MNAATSSRPAPARAADGGRSEGGGAATADATRPRASLAQQAALLALRAYQGARAGHVSPCRFYPSCSAYAVEAVEQHGAARGLWMAGRRVLRCRPFGGHGVDPVPLEGTGRRRGRTGGRPCT